MKKLSRSYTFMALVALLFSGIGAIAYAQRPDPAPQAAQAATSLPKAEVHIKSTPQALPKGQYINYEPGIIEKTQGTKLLFFHAPWCSQCQAIDASIKSQGLEDGVSVIKIDYDNSVELRKKYGITLQTTFVRVNDNGDLVKKFVAYNEPTFDSVRRELL